MKKVVYIILSIAVAASIPAVLSVRHRDSAVFTQNVEALTDGETHAFGYCDKSTSDECTGVCSDCGQLVYAPDHFGVGYNIHHI